MVKKRLHLMGSAEIRVRLGGISRQRVYQITQRRDFPVGGEPILFTVDEAEGTDYTV